MRGSALERALFPTALVLGAATLLFGGALLHSVTAETGEREAKVAALASLSGLPGPALSGATPHSRLPLLEGRDAPLFPAGGDALPLSFVYRSPQ